MIRKLLIFVLCAMTLASCKFRHILSEEEYNELDKAILEFDIDWSELNETPTGVTLVFFPKKPSIDSLIHTIHSNNVNHVKATLPNQDYSVICFNQSETEFGALKFGFDSFEDAFVQMKSDEEMGNVSTKFDWTRGFSAQTSIKPQSFASGSLSSVKINTRGFSAQTSIKPQSSIRGMSVKVNVFGLNRAVLIKSKITNLASGVTLNNNKPLSKTVDQHIASDAWDINLSTAETVPSQISTTFGTFGIDESLFKKTRGDEVSTTEPCRNILNITFATPDNQVVEYNIDITDILLQQWYHFSNAETDPSEVYTIEIGSSTDYSATNHSKVDYTTEKGTIVIHETSEIMNVGVKGWEQDTIVNVQL